VRVWRDSPFSVNADLHYISLALKRFIGGVTFYEYVNLWYGWITIDPTVNLTDIYIGDSLENAKIFVENYWILQDIKAAPWINNLQGAGYKDFIGEL